MENGASSTPSQVYANDIVIKISHHHETVRNAQFPPNPDRKKCSYIARKNYYSVDDINNNVLSLPNSTMNHLNATTNDEYTYFTPHKYCQRCSSTKKVKYFTEIGKEYGERLSSSVKDAGDGTSHKINEIKVSKK